MTKRKVPKALAEVWAWKDACYREVAHLSTREAIKKRLADCDKAALRPGSAKPEAGVRAHRTARVAERKSLYDAKRSRKS